MSPIGQVLPLVSGLWPFVSESKPRRDLPSRMHKRIAILADFPWGFFAEGATGRGGGQACTWLAQLADEFSKGTGYEIHWVSLDRSRMWGGVQKREWDGQWFLRVPAGRRRIDLELAYLPSRLALSRALRGIKPNLLHCWGTEESFGGMLGWRGLPGLLSMQGVLTEYARIGSFSGMRFWEKLARSEPKIVRKATLVTCESQWGIDRVREVAPTADLRMVEYGVHPGFYDLQWTPEEQCPYVLYSGSIDRRKGVDILIEATESLTERRWKLKLAGDGPLRQMLEARNTPGVEWLGVLNWRDLQRELAGASCLVLPTKADTSPNVAKEARVVGLPVITTRHGGQAGYIADGENGLIVEPVVPEGIARALARVMEDRELARAMGACHHERDREYFRPERTASGFIALYDELLARL